LTIYNETLNFLLKVVVKLVIPANTLEVLIPQKIIIKPKWRQKWKKASTSLNMSFRILYGFWWQTQMTLLWWLTRYLHGNFSAVVLNELYILWGEQRVEKESYKKLCLNNSKLFLMFSSVSRRILASFISFVYYMRSCEGPRFRNILAFLSSL